MTQKDHDQYLIKFVKHLKQLNEKLDIEIPKTNIEEILTDPKKYAYEFIEIEFARAIPFYISAYKAGKEFAKANEGVIIKDDLRYYIDGQEIDPKLPDKYGIGDTLNHPGQECHNCKYYVETKNGNYCAAWDAEVRDEYWCKKWKKTKGDGDG